MSNIKEMLEFDPIATAEEIVGKGEKADGLGLMLAMVSGQMKKDALKELKDSFMGMNVEEYLEITSRLGFAIVSIEEFKKNDTYGWTHPTKGFISTPYIAETQLYILWNEEKSILLKFDTYPKYQMNETLAEPVFVSASINSASIFYNWIPKQKEKMYEFTSSGGLFKEPGTKWDDLEEYIWVGDHDAREGLAHKITQLSENGTFLKEWKKCAFYSLMHYLEWKPEYRNGLSQDEIMEKRIKSLPESIQSAIKFKK